jgi:thiol-disulfide isomerase/thioredoxin
MKRSLVVALSILLLCTGCGATGESVAGATPAAEKPGGALVVDGGDEEAYDFTLQTIDGASVTLSDLRGNWVLVNFWATWCPPCVEEMPYLETLSSERDIEVIGINLNEKEDVVAKFLSDNGITFPILMDPDEVTQLMYEARALPRTVVVAPDGKIAGRVYGRVSPDSFDSWLDEQGVAQR